MSIGARVVESILDVEVSDIVAEARRWGHDPDRTRAAVVEVASQAADAAGAIDHDPLAALVHREAERLTAT
jgi:hypothetical protein